MREIIPENDFPRDILDKPIQIELTIKELIAIRCALGKLVPSYFEQSVETYYGEDFAKAFDENFTDVLYDVSDDVLGILCNYEIE